ncbi:DNA polymerase III subunit delta [Pseudoruegeria sp. SK021]|uniref:DNA polymerase III subunit delta n=1 Tax=Pseudoruegeria sp. SK021 TaxID=1933035 RepID=UPI000A251D79|nr:DNA polymerase III subunit delta [Pseudoruegeria sp. SK021]OSP55063.1 DNA polymerase III subunit delta [Pseudoruegeria sp. SK021]
MKLSPRDAPGYFSRPDPSKAGILIYGPDAMRVALKRAQLLSALLGPDAEAEMRLTRLAPGDLRGDPAALADATRAIGFFPGPRAVLVEAAPDPLAKAVQAALEDWRAGDAQIVLTAGNLGKGAALRKLFESHPKVYAAAVYADPPSRAEIDAVISRAGLDDLDGSARADLTALAALLDPGDFAQTVEKLALYKLSDPTPVTPEDIAAIAPLSTESGIDDLLDVVAEARRTELWPTLRRLTDQGLAPVTLCIGATRHFRTLHAIAAHPGGASEGINRLRPPLFGPRRTKMQRQAQNWGAARLEQALSLLVETDLSLRGGGATAPAAAVMERALFRLTYMGAR